MTREKAKDLFREDKNSYGGVKSPMSKVDQIYDEFEKELKEAYELIVALTQGDVPSNFDDVVGKAEQYVGEEF